VFLGLLQCAWDVIKLNWVLSCESGPLQDGYFNGAALVLICVGAGDQALCFNGVANRVQARFFTASG
jgi:hypothetical protein